MKIDNQIVISFSDFFRSINRSRCLLFVISLLCACTFFVKQLIKAPTFTSEGLFKGVVSNNSGSILSKLMPGGLQESYHASDDPKAFLKSYPVLEDVVKSMHLQLSITGSESRSLLKSIWYNLNAEKAQRLLKNGSSPPTKQIVPDKNVILKCVQLDYPDLLKSSCCLFFVDDTHFQVKQKKEVLCTGELGKPCLWRGGSFTLESSHPMKGRKFGLTFYPLSFVVDGLEKQITVNQDKFKSSVVHVSFTSQDRILSKRMVDGVMSSFQKYLKANGKRKVDEQLDYLKRRENDVIRAMEKQSKSYQEEMESDLDAGKFFVFEKELGFAVSSYASKYKSLEGLSYEICLLYKNLNNRYLNIAEILAELGPTNEHHEITERGIDNLILECEKVVSDLDGIDHKYSICIKDLSNDSCEFLVCEGIEKEEKLKVSLENLNKLQRNLCDVGNWSEKERAQIEEQIGVEKKIIVKYLEGLKKNIVLTRETLLSKLKELKKEKLFCLIDRYKNHLNDLKEDGKKYADLPKRMLSERNRTFEQKMQLEIVESLAKLVEVKNIGYNLDYIDSAPLMPATDGVIPNPPHLFFSFLIGGLAGFFFVIVVIVVREIWLGPTFSSANLKSANKPFVDFTNKAQDYLLIYNQLHDKGKVFSVVSQNYSFVEKMSNIFAKRGEKVLIIDLTEHADSISYREAEFGQILKVGVTEHLDKWFVGSHEFYKIFNTQKSIYDRIIFHSTQPVGVISSLVNYVIFFPYERRFTNFSELPDKTLFVIEKIKKEPLSIKQVLPVLERLISFSLNSRKEKSTLEGSL